LKALLIATIVLLGCSGGRGTLGLFGDADPRVLYSVQTDERVVALTIDDGPDPETTPRILDVLARNRATATFFVIGDRIPNNEPLLAALVAEGHELGNHMTHDEPSIELAPEQFEHELLEARATLSSFNEPLWFRPGSGWYDAQMLDQLDRHGYRCALGSIYPLDAHVPWSWFATRFILWRIAPGAVIVLHDGPERGERTTRTLAALLPELDRMGYRVVTLSELSGAATTGADRSAGVDR